MNKYDWIGGVEQIPHRDFRHFRGKVYHVSFVAPDETSGKEPRLMVGYYCLEEDNFPGVYIRELDDFLAELDPQKYPEAKQKHRFEPLDLAYWTN